MLKHGACWWAARERGQLWEPELCSTSSPALHWERFESIIMLFHELSGPQEFQSWWDMFSTVLLLLMHFKSCRNQWGPLLGNCSRTVPHTGTAPTTWSKVCLTAGGQSLLFCLMRVWRSNSIAILTCPQITGWLWRISPRCWSLWKLPQSFLVGRLMCHSLLYFQLYMAFWASWLPQKMIFKTSVKLRSRLLQR